MLLLRPVLVLLLPVLGVETFRLAEARRRPLLRGESLLCLVQAVMQSLHR